MTDIKYTIQHILQLILSLNSFRDRLIPLLNGELFEGHQIYEEIDLKLNKLFSLRIL